MTLPGETFLYFVIMRATMSVPPVLPPTEKQIPIPTPASAPPQIAHTSLPLLVANSTIKSVGIYCGKNWKYNETTTVAKTVLNPNDLPKTFSAIANSTVFIIKNEILTGIPNAYKRIAEIPVTPPPTIWFGIRKISHPRQ